MTHPDHLDLSVIIPTLNRVDQLEYTLGILAEQDQQNISFEIVVVDNNSSDGTDAFLRCLNEFPVPLTTRFQERPGPAGAKNTGVEAARGDLVMFIGDDTEPAEPDLFEQHVAFHRDTPEDQMLLGQIVWTPKKPITPFMEWLVTDGPQFDFTSIDAGSVTPARYLYGSHVSLKRSLFLKTGGYDGRLPDAFEDVEYGARLERLGAKLEYKPELVLWHDHPTTLEDSLRRMERVGRSAAYYNHYYPDHPHQAIQRPEGLKWRLRSIYNPVLPAIPGSKAMWERHMHHYAVGYRRALPEFE